MWNNLPHGVVKAAYGHTGHVCTFGKIYIVIVTATYEK